TYKPEVARTALDAGASIINDITGLADPLMRKLAAERQVPVVIMHMRGSPQTMQDNPVYEDLISEIMDFLRQRVDQTVEAGLKEEYIIIDPGIGFGKTAEHNLEIIRRLGDFRSLGFPILIGPSRKSFIGKILGDILPTERMEGTAASVAISIANGANIIRVHDVKQMVKVARMADAISRLTLGTQSLQ
ncbi:MAG: dihydropteroate synthase, partial [Armatimonadota bacterium]|nr:dihydropteroate synthase [Armatimonadota bacterium]